MNVCKDMFTLFAKEWFYIIPVLIPADMRRDPRVLVSALENMCRELPQKQDYNIYGKYSIYGLPMHKYFLLKRAELEFAGDLTIEVRAWITAKLKELEENYPRLIQFWADAEMHKLLDISREQMLAE